ncbi:MAG: hypothetical protein ACLTTU_09200 [Bilophila wadsworthia]
MSRPPGGGQPEAAHTGMPRLRLGAGTGTVRFPIWRGGIPPGCFIASPHRRDVIDDFVSHTGARIATGLWDAAPTRACLRFLADHARSKGTVFKEYLKNGSAGMACGAFPRWRRTRIPTSRGPTSGGCCPRSRCGS